MVRDQAEKSVLERRLSNLTVQALRNYCNVTGIAGVSNLKKKELTKLLAVRADRNSLEEFLSSSEADYLMDSFRKAVKWGKSNLIVRIDSRSSEKELHAEFNGLDVGLRRIYYVDFYDVTNPRNTQTSCECEASQKKGLFCPHQMAVLLKGLSEGVIRLQRWKGPMTPEVREAIRSQFSPTGRR